MERHIDGHRGILFHHFSHHSGWSEDASPQEIKQWLDIHNQFRAQHQVGPVTWSDTVAASIQAFVETCPAGHSGNLKYGENWGASYGMTLSISDMVTGWYQEEEDYNYSNPELSSDVIGHFTQIVWKGTTEIGCALITNCPRPWPESTIWMCQYNPRGNLQGQYSENVFPKKAVGPSPPTGLQVD